MARYWSTIAPGLTVTLSMGLAASHAGESGRELYDRADARLYAAKRAGRDTYRLAANRDVINSAVSPGVPEGHFKSAAAASGGPQPRPARGR